MKGYGLTLLIALLVLLSPGREAAAQGTSSPGGTGAGDLVFIRGGEFTMGSPESEMWREPDEFPHTVRLGSFYMGRREVTQEEYSALTGENPSSFAGVNLPVEGVTWLEAVAYCNALSRRENRKPAYRVEGKRVEWDREADGYRLPTEAEWEYACRAGTATPFSFGDAVAPEECNYFGYYPYGVEDHYFDRYDMETPPGIYREKTVPVDSFGSNPWGLYNMHGNVSEWCYDIYGEYGKSDPDNPAGAASGWLRVCRGGGWNDFAKHLRSAYRSATPPNDRFYSRGFRVARNGE